MNEKVSNKSAIKRLREINLCMGLSICKGTSTEAYDGWSDDKWFGVFLFNICGRRF